MRIITNNPAKYGGLEGFGLDITERVPSVTAPNPENIAYLRTKRDRLGHLLEGLDEMAGEGAVPTPPADAPEPPPGGPVPSDGMAAGEQA